MKVCIKTICAGTLQENIFFKRKRNNVIASIKLVKIHKKFCKITIYRSLKLRLVF